MAVAKTLAIPYASVTTVVLERIALAPVEGAANVTVTPLTGFPAASFTKACRGLEKFVDMVAD